MRRFVSLRYGARRRRGPFRAAVLALLIAVVPGGCADGTTELVLASATSLDDSGLLDVVIPAFEKAHPDVRVKVLAVGSGEALALGKRKEADVLLVHAPLAEVLFMEAGYGELRRDVAYNDFVIVGPAHNPAGLTPVMRAVEGFRRIAAAGEPFVSRGDSSGTHMKELALWIEAGIRPSTPWYVDVGEGMAETLRVASERHAYTLTDRSTFLTQMRNLQLGIVLEGDDMLYNPYGVIVVAGAKNLEAAQAFATWLTGPGQDVIGRFGRDRFEQALYTPNAVPPQ